MAIKRAGIMITKAIITAAGKGTRQYPATNAVQKELFPLVDHDGITKPTLQVIIEEVMNAGIQEIAVIVQPGEEQQFKQHFTGLSEKGREGFRGKAWGLEQSRKLEQMSRAITYIHQSEQKGFGHAVFCAGEWAGSEPTLLLLGDHVYLSHEKRSCARQVLDVFAQVNKSVFSVQRTPVDQLHLFGVVSGRMIGSDSRFFKLDNMAEKPSIDYARHHLRVPQLPPDIFLAIFGIYALTPTVFQILSENIRLDKRENGEIQLTTALAELISREVVIGYEASGQRLDMGTPLGYLQTQLALAKAGPFASDLQEFMNNLIET
jgi:UTP--glucose-1-phosphate uridylyltransferase